MIRMAPSYPPSYEYNYMDSGYETTGRSHDGSYQEAQNTTGYDDANSSNQANASDGSDHDTSSAYPHSSISYQPASQYSSAPLPEYHHHGEAYWLEGQPGASSTGTNDNHPPSYSSDYGPPQREGVGQIEESKVSCPHCQELLANGRGLQKHIQRKHSEGKQHKKVKCNECDQTFENSKDLKRHTPKHTKEQAFTCPYCNTPFTRIDNMQRHINLYHI